MGMKFALFYEIPVPKPWKPDSEHQAYKNTLEQAILGDQVGFHAFWTVEHHFLEEYSHCSNPEVLYGAIAARTQNIRIGYGVRLLPAPYNHPIRSAESAAVLDLLSDGRVDFGTGRSSTRMELEGFDVNAHETRQMWQEALGHIVSAWTEEEYQADGKYWRMGAPRRVQPKPLQKPHPPIFQPFASSENTIRWCAREGVTAILPPMYLRLQNRLYDVYREEAAAQGRMLAPGEGLGLLRDVIVADTDAEALELWGHGAAFCGAAWFAPFHFGDVLVDPESNERPTPQDMIDSGMLLVGSVDTVTRSMERILKDTPMRWLFAWTYNGLVPHGAIMKSLDLFATKVLPRFAGGTERQ